MRVTNVVMFSGESELASFALGLGETPDRYLLKSMSGIDADGITPRFYKMGERTGLGLFDFGLPPREIVLLISLNPKFKLDETFSELRDRLYRAISANRTGIIRMEFNAGSSKVAQIQGFIVKFEGSHFTKKPEVQLTLRCDDPFFRATNPTTYSSDDIGVSNPITIPDSLSTAPHGFVMSMVFDSTADMQKIQDVAVNPEWTFQVYPPGGFLVGDILTFSSEPANKFIEINRGGDIIPIADGLTLASVWPIIFPGVNTFHLVEMASVGSFEIMYYPAYWGI